MVPLTAVFCFAGRDASYAVRLCKSPQCPRMVWNRDVNASINMLHLLLAFARKAMISLPRFVEVLRCSYYRLVAVGGDAEREEMIRMSLDNWRR